jgi:hypothetical protein
MIPGSLCIGFYVYVLVLQFVAFSPVNALVSPNDPMTSFPGEDIPMQLIHPDINHDHLYLNDDTIAMLKRLNMPVAVVGGMLTLDGMHFVSLLITVGFY